MSYSICVPLAHDLSVQIAVNTSDCKQANGDASFSSYKMTQQILEKLTSVIYLHNI